MGNEFETGDAFGGFVDHYEIFVDTPFGRITVDTLSHPASAGTGSLRPVGINDESQVVTVREEAGSGQRLGMIFNTRHGNVTGRFVNQLIPAGSPGGNYIPVAVGGRFLVVEHERAPNDKDGLFLLTSDRLPRRSSAR